MSLHRRRRAVPARGRGFTIIEMLVVISIIMILAGMILPALSSSKGEARIVKCLSNLKQIGIALGIYQHNYGKDSELGYPPWVTMLLTCGGKENKYIDNPKVFMCPDDGSKGLEGGRPDSMKTSGGVIIDQFPMADIDEHPAVFDAGMGKAYLDGNSSHPTNSTNGGINCSYLFEYNGEPCDWIYGSPPITPSTGAGVPEAPDAPEWTWSSTPDWATFKAMADTNGDGVLSWAEVKNLSRKGDKEHGLTPWDIRVPILRCYWHAAMHGVLANDSIILNLRSDLSAADRGVPAWFEK